MTDPSEAFMCPRCKRIVPIPDEPLYVHGIWVAWFLITAVLFQVHSGWGVTFLIFMPWVIIWMKGKGVFQADEGHPDHPVHLGLIPDHSKDPDKGGIGGDK